MSDNNEKKQLFFDFEGFSDAGTSSGPTPEKKVRDDSAPGLFDSDLTEEEEMDAFLQEVRSSENPAEGSAAAESAGECPADPAPEISADPAEIPPVDPDPEPAGSEADAEPDISGDFRTLTPKQLKRGAMAFLASLQPSGLAMDVAAGGRCRADAAAFWLQKGAVVRSALVEIQTGFDESIDGKNELFDSLKLARMEREILEQEIRQTEPDLRDRSQLFTEFSDWNYEVSKNPSYRECLQKIRKIEHTLYHGTRLERLIRTRAASELYLIVPENAVAPDYPLNGCGLVYIRKDLSFELIRRPEPQENVSAESQMRLTLNIAASNMADVLFANGIYANGSGIPKCGPLPRRRHLKN